MSNFLELIEELEETVLRLHVNARRMESSYDGFQRVRKKIESKRKLPLLFTRQDRREESEWREYKYYQGKLEAYMYVLEQWGYSMTPRIIRRLRGQKLFSKERAKIIETKFYDKNNKLIKK